ncbi:ganglioside GM2 activator-like [Haliotis rufescens]|uniref:ganglioside GM2 activator-like n=1 Tax=Haliotis rufescens TaxID=6454 RepID=UPI001EAFAD3D|nr:ganglioside GM2 activator-like [Haliotis rufescens]
MLRSAMAGLLCLLLWLGVCAAADLTKLEWSDCGSDSGLTIHKIDISPMPVVVPGDLHLTINASSTRKQLNQMKLSVHVKRDTFLLNIPIPCLFHVGSCTYDDTCTLLATMQKENWAGIMGDIGLQIQQMLASVGITTYCPAVVQSIDLQDYVLKMPAVPSILSWFAEGNYEATATAVDTATGEQMLCLNVKLTVKEKKEPCTGWLCGRRRRSQH